MKNIPISLVLVAAFAFVGTAAVSQAEFQGSEQGLKFAREAERSGDVAGAAEQYTTLFSLMQAGPDFGKMELGKVDGEPISSIGRRMVYWQIRRLHEEMGKDNPSMDVHGLLRDLQGAYGKMSAMEKYNPTWYYLDAVASAADGKYRQAYRLCQSAATAPGGEESVREKARTLAKHIKAGAEAQDKMHDEDVAAYEDYVRSGRQALDFAIVSARCSADAARRNGDHANADMWEQKYSELNRKKNDQMQSNGGKWYP